MQTLELLSPAKNLECGIAAIDHGADAVYIGAESGGARAAAGNSTDVVGFGTRVTIVYEDELTAIRELLRRLADAGVDAILAQDMALLQMPRYGMELHASTQTDNRTAEKTAWHASFRSTTYGASIKQCRRCSWNVLYTEHCACRIQDCATPRNTASSAVPTEASAPSSAAWPST